MRVNVNGIWYDIDKDLGVDTLCDFIILELTDKDKENIANMHPDAHFFGSFSDRMSREEMQGAMDDATGKE